MLGSGAVWAALHPPALCRTDRAHGWIAKQPQELIDKATAESLVYPFEPARAAGLTPVPVSN